MSARSRCTRLILVSAQLRVPSGTVIDKDRQTQLLVDVVSPQAVLAQRSARCDSTAQVRIRPVKIVIKQALFHLPLCLVHTVVAIESNWTMITQKGVVNSFWLFLFLINAILYILRRKPQAKLSSHRLRSTASSKFVRFAPHILLRHWSESAATL